MIKDVLLHVSRSYSPYVEQTEFIATGDTWYGTLDDNMAAGVFQKVNYPESITTINDASAGQQAYFIAGDGTLWGWGGTDHHLGRNSTNTTMRSSPVQIGTETNWFRIAAGHNNFSFGIKTDGTLWSWGTQNTQGELGLGDNVNNSRSKPTQIGSRNDWLKVKATINNGFALTTTGELWGWGQNDNGILATSDTINRSSPIQIGKELWNDIGLKVLDFDVSKDSVGLSNKHLIAVVQNIADIDNLRDLWGWGTNTQGQLGIGDLVSRSSPVQITDISAISGDPSFKRVACGDVHTLAVMEETPGFPDPLHRTLWAWGNNTYGQLGDNTGTGKSSPVQIGTRTDWDTPYAVNNSSFGILGTTNPGIGETGQLWVWGSLSGNHISGFPLQSINGVDIIDRSSPVQITMANNRWKMVSANRSRSVSIISDDIGSKLYAAGGLRRGNTSRDEHFLGIETRKSISIRIQSDKIWNKMSIGDHTVAIDSSGSLWTWGLNTIGQLGTGDKITIASPVQIGTETNWSDVNVGSSHTIALKSDGTIWSWGLNNFGQLGISQDSTSHRSSPVQIGTETNWFKLPKKIGLNVSAAIKTDNTLWMWGYNNVGQLGDNSIVSRSAPVKIGDRSYSVVSTTGSHTIALANNGSIWAWGSGGRLGINESTNRQSPVQIGTRTDWVDIDTVTNGSFFIRNDNTAWVAGLFNNDIYRLGAYYNDKLLTYIYDMDSINPTYSKASCGVNANLVLKPDGTLWMWGYSNNGVIGDRSATNFVRSSPVQIGTETNWFDADCSGTGTTADQSGTGANTYAIKTDGTLWGWGDNNGNQLGIASTTADRSSPVQIGTLSTWTSSKIFAGNACAFIIRTDGTLWAWGSGAEGRTGLSINANRSLPTQVGNRSNWSMVSNRTNHTIALQTDGTLWAWGNNAVGQHGDNKAGNTKSSPVQIGTETNWSNVTAGLSATMAIKTDGTLWGWGQNSNYNLGLTDLARTVTRSNPTQVGTDMDWVKVVNTVTAAFGLKTDGSIWGWGAFNSYWGDTLDNNTNNRSSPIRIGSYTEIIDIYAGNETVIFKDTNDRLLQNGVAGEARGRFKPSFVIARSSPVLLAQYTAITDIDCGIDTTSVVTKRTDGLLYHFGDNSSGQSGLGDLISRSSPVQLGHDLLHDDYYVGKSNIVMKKTY